eukprot:COSAG06_NODE_28909_length_565_cov_5.484979_2_plen_64_part_01
MDTKATREMDLQKVHDEGSRHCDGRRHKERQQAIRQDLHTPFTPTVSNRVTLLAVESVAVEHLA